MSKGCIPSAPENQLRVSSLRRLSAATVETFLNNSKLPPSRLQQYFSQPGLRGKVGEIYRLCCVIRDGQAVHREQMSLLNMLLDPEFEDVSRNMLRQYVDFGRILTHKNGVLSQTLSILVQGKFARRAEMLSAVLEAFFEEHSSKNAVISPPHEETDVLRVLLEKGASPNEPSHLLAFAVNFCSVEVCKLLLQYDADPDSFFKATRDEEFSRQLQCGYQLHIGRETALHCAIRRKSLNKTRLLLQHGADTAASFMGRTALELALASGASAEILNALSQPRNLLRAANDSFFMQRGRILGSSLDNVRQAQHFYSFGETQSVFEGVCGVMEFLVENVDVTFRQNFRCSLTGSFAEGTKVERPDEFDFTFFGNAKNKRNSIFAADEREWQGFAESSGKISALTLAQSFYLSCAHAVRSLTEHGPARIHPCMKTVSFIRDDKISRVRLVWEGKLWRKLEIFVDLAVCMVTKDAEHFEAMKMNDIMTKAFKCRHSPPVTYIAKASRCGFSSGIFLLSSDVHERFLFQRFSKTVKDAFILAKAVRRGDIVAPFGADRGWALTEDVHVCDVITSFMLKSSLITVLSDTQHSRVQSVYLLTRQIYQHILEELAGEKRELTVWFDNSTTLLHCTNCRTERGCCRRRLLTVKMCRNVIVWLEANKTKLRGVSFFQEHNNHKTGHSVRHRESSSVRQNFSPISHNYMYMYMYVSVVHVRLPGNCKQSQHLQRN